MAKAFVYRQLRYAGNLLGCNSTISDSACSFGYERPVRYHFEPFSISPSFGPTGSDPNWYCYEVPPQLQAVVFSPVKTHPSFRANRQRIIQVASLLKESGFTVSLAMGSKQGITAEARTFWDRVIPLSPAPKWRPRRTVSSFDSWYREGLGEALRGAVEDTGAHVVLFNYIFHSRALELLSSETRKVLDTHQAFSTESSDYHFSLRRGFFSCTPDEERKYLNRADVTLGLSDEDSRTFQSLGVTSSITTLPFAIRTQDKAVTLSSPKRPRWGVLMSANDDNLESLLRLIDATTRIFGGNPPFHIVVAGDVDKLAFRYFPHRAPRFLRSWISYQGTVQDVESFYRQVDGVIVPVIAGTGMAGKFVDPIARGVPVVSTTIGSRGSQSDHPLHLFTDLEDLISHVVELSPKDLVALGKYSAELNTDLNERTRQSWNSLELGHSISKKVWR